MNEETKKEINELVEVLRKRKQEHEKLLESASNVIDATSVDVGNLFDCLMIEADTIVEDWMEKADFREAKLSEAMFCCIACFHCCQDDGRDGSVCSKMCSDVEPRLKKEKLTPDCLQIPKKFQNYLFEHAFYAALFSVKPLNTCRFYTEFFPVEDDEEEEEESD